MLLPGHRVICSPGTEAAGAQGAGALSGDGHARWGHRGLWYREDSAWAAPTLVWAFPPVPPGSQMGSTPPHGSDGERTDR